MIMVAREEKQRYGSDFDLAMRCVGTAAWTEFFDHELLGLSLFVLGGRVVPPLAAIAR
jgi:hypothetical protein